MKRLAFSLAFLFSFATSVFANFGSTGGHLTGFWQKPLVAASTPASITFLQCASDTTDLTTYTFSSQNTGTASATRTTIVTVHSEDSAAAFTVSTLTVGGDSASKLIEADNSAVGSFSSAIFALTNTSGTSEDVVVTMSEAVTGVSICLYQANDVSSLTAVDTERGGIATPITLDLNTQADGIAIGAYTNQATAQSATWSGLSENSDASSGEFRYSSAASTTTTTETPRSVSVSWSANSAYAVAVSLR